MKIVKIILILLFANVVFSQDSWVYDDFENRKSDWEYIMDVKQLDDNKLISLSRSLDPVFHVLRIHDIKTGNVIKDLNLDYDSTYYSNIYMNDEREEIYVFGTGISISDSIKEGYIVVDKYDFNLNLISKQIKYLPDGKYLQSDFQVNRFKNGFVICSDNVKKDTGTLNYLNLIFEIDLKGDIKSTIVPKNKYSIRNVIEKIGGEGYWGIGGVVLYSFDKLFNVESEKDNFDRSGGGLTAFGFIYDDSTYLLGSPCFDGKNSPDKPLAIRVSKHNKGFSVRKETLFHYEGRYTTLITKGISYYYKDAIYMSAMDYWDLTYFDVLKFDEDLNLL